MIIKIQFLFKNKLIIMLMSIKIAYIDFWQECENIPEKLEDINNLKYWNNLIIIKKLKLINEGIGLFHKSYLEKIIEKKIIITHPNEAELLICSVFGQIKKNYPNKKKIYINFESNKELILPNTLYFSSNLEFSLNSNLEFSVNNYYLPIYTCYYGFDIYDSLKQKRELISEEYFNKKNNIISIISNKSGFFRNFFLSSLMNKIQVDNYGKYKRNILNKIISESTWFDPRIGDIIKNYKFILCMENVEKVGYHTEKIIHGFRNNVIPIYWGDTNCIKIFNSKAYINVNELGIEKSIEKIIELSQDINKYNNMLSESILHEDSILYENKFKKYLSEENFIKTIKEFIYLYQSGNSVYTSKLLL